MSKHVRATRGAKEEDKVEEEEFKGKSKEKEETSVLESEWLVWVDRTGYL